MPVFLLHGFRWPRPLIRIHIILQNLEDAAAEWLVAPGTIDAMLDNFRELFPLSMQHLDCLRFVEQYDPDDISAEAASQPYAYVADSVEEIRLSVDVDDIRGHTLSPEQLAAMVELRDKIAPEEKVGWYIVVCGDEERLAPSTPTEQAPSERAPVGVNQEEGVGDSTCHEPGRDLEGKQLANYKPKGFRKLFGRGRFGGRRKGKSGGVISSASQGSSFTRSPSKGSALPESAREPKYSQ